VSERNFNDWLQAYCEYASFSEAPRRMHFFAGVSAIAGALRRRVWVEQNYYRYYSNHYIIFVAPPGVVSKSTTAGLAMDLLRQVPGIYFGPDVVTWPALVTAFAAHSEQFPIALPEGGQEFHAQCALTIVASELGNLINPDDREMIDLLVNLWDCRQGAFKKSTKGSGNDVVENPWINIVGCTTPAWIAGSFPEYIIGGGFTSRVLFVYAEKKEKLVAYPSRHMPKNMAKIQELLVQDLEYIATKFVGAFSLTPEAIEWGEEWYKNHNNSPPKLLQDDRFGGYLSRKQAHLHKLAMILSVSSRDDMLITHEDLANANVMISSLEEDLPKVFSKIGQSDKGLQATRFINFVHSQGRVNLKEAYRYIHAHFPDAREFRSIVEGAVASGQIMVIPEGTEMFLVPRGQPGLQA
jgi:hypothetical protein